MGRKEANEKVLGIMQDSEVHLVGMAIAKDVVPGMHPKLIMHAGPPIGWERMCGPMKGAVMGALLYEGLADTPEEAETLAASGEIEFSPNHEHQAIAPMAGIISPNMPVFIMKNMTYGNLAYSGVNEGQGKCLRFGAYGQEVIKRLHWIREVVYPVLKEAIELSGGIDYKGIVTQAMQMGDDNHNRNKASTCLLMRELAKYLVQVRCRSAQEIYGVLEHIEKIDMFNINLTMAMCKAISDAAAGVPGSTIVTVMARNGVDFGIRVSGCGDRWFTAPANIPEGLYFPGYTAADAAADIGDSAITETVGVGGMAMVAAPGVTRFVGAGGFDDALAVSNEQEKICVTHNPNWTIPTWDFKGTCLGIDIRKVVATGITPLINTGIAHKKAGIGQVGAGTVRAPLACFEKALEAYAKKLGIE